MNKGALIMSWSWIKSHLKSKTSSVLQFNPYLLLYRLLESDCSSTGASCIAFKPVELRFVCRCKWWFFFPTFHCKPSIQQLCYHLPDFTRWESMVWLVKGYFLIFSILKEWRIVAWIFLMTAIGEVLARKSGVKPLTGISPMESRNSRFHWRRSQIPQLQLLDWWTFLLSFCGEVVLDCLCLMACDQSESAIFCAGRSLIL